MVLLLNQIIHEASQHYQILTLRTDTLVGDKFHQKLGFKVQPSWEHTTHHLQLSDVMYYPCLDGEDMPEQISADS